MDEIQETKFLSIINYDKTTCKWHIDDIAGKTVTWNWNDYENKAVFKQINVTISFLYLPMSHLQQSYMGIYL